MPGRGEGGTAGQCLLIAGSEREGAVERPLGLRVARRVPVGPRLLDVGEPQACPATEVPWLGAQMGLQSTDPRVQVAPGERPDRERPGRGSGIGAGPRSGLCSVPAAADGDRSGGHRDRQQRGAHREMRPARAARGGGEPAQSGHAHAGRGGFRAGPGCLGPGLRAGGGLGPGPGPGAGLGLGAGGGPGAGAGVGPVAGARPRVRGPRRCRGPRGRGGPGQPCGLRRSGVPAALRGVVVRTRRHASPRLLAHLSACSRDAGAAARPVPRGWRGRAAPVTGAGQKARLPVGEAGPEP